MHNFICMRPQYSAKTDSIESKIMPVSETSVDGIDSSSTVLYNQPAVHVFVATMTVTEF